MGLDGRVLRLDIGTMIFRLWIYWLERTRIAWRTKRERALKELSGITEIQL